MTILQPVFNMAKYCLQIIILNFNKTHSTFFIFNNDHLTTLYCWVLSKEVSSTISKVFGTTRPGIQPRSPRLPGEHSTHKANEVLRVKLL